MGWKRKLVITTLVLGAIGGGAYYSYSSGWLEETLSTTSIPFEFFRVDDKLSAREQKVKDSQRKSIAEYKEMVKPVLEPFNGSKGAPTLNDKLDAANWTKLLDPIYGVEFQYVGSAVMSGLTQDKDGWHPLVTLSIYNDSAAIRNLTLKIIETKDGLKPIVIRDSSDDFAYSELPTDFNMSLVDLSSTVDQRFYENKVWENATASIYSEEDKKRLEDADNHVKTGVLFIFSDTAVHQYHKYGTTKTLYQIDRSYPLDTLAVNKNTMLVPMTITETK